MVRNDERTELDEKERIYPIGIAADLLSVHPRTLRIYEDAGLLKPMRRRGRRYYTEEDLSWLECIRHLIHDEKISVEGLKRLVRLQDCWEIRGCGGRHRARCGRRGSGAGRGHGRPSDDVKHEISKDGKEE